MAVMDPEWNAGEAAPQVSQTERRFEWWRRTVGLFLGPAAFATLLALPLPGLSVEAHRLAAIVVAGRRVVGHRSHPRRRHGVARGRAHGRSGCGNCAGCPCALRQPDDLPLPRELHPCGGDRGARARSPAGLRAAAQPVARLLPGPRPGGGRPAGCGPLDVDEQHGHRGHAASRGARVARRNRPGGRCGRQCDRVPPRAGLFGLDRRRGHAGRHAPQPDRHRHARSPGRSRRGLLPLDGARRSALGRDVRGTHRDRALHVPRGAQDGDFRQRRPKRHRAQPAR